MKAQERRAITSFDFTNPEDIKAFLKQNDWPEGSIPQMVRNWSG